MKTNSNGPQLNFLLPTFASLFLATALITFGQDRMVSAGAGQPKADTPAHLTSPMATGGKEISNYILGPEDKLLVSSPDIDEIKQTLVQIDLRGNVDLPLVGIIHAAGMTADELTTGVNERARKFIREPHIAVTISEYHSQSVSVLGSVNNPGIMQLQGNKTLIEVISLAGGLRPDAGDTIQVTRLLQWGKVPLRNAVADATGQYSVASVKVKSVMRSTEPTDNIALRPGDVVSVPKAELVYCVGSVRKPGGFLLGQNESLSALQVIALAEGLDKNAAPAKAKVLRVVAGSNSRAEIPIDLKLLTAGRSADLPLRSDDILFVPNSVAKSVGTRTLEAMVQAATGVAIYGRY